MNIFVSYTLRDGLLNPGLLSGLEYLLSEVGTPYIDILHNNSPRPQEHVMAMLNEASVFCACVTPGFHQSEWVRLECAMARKLNLPVMKLDGQSLVDIADLAHLNITSRVTKGNWPSLERAWQRSHKPSLLPR